MPAKKKKKRFLITRSQLARVIFRTMRIEQPRMTKAMAKKAANKIRLAR